MPMPIKFSYRKMGERDRRMYDGQLVDWTKNGDAYVSMLVRCSKGLARFRMDRVVEEDRSYVLNCLQALEMFKETMYRIEMRNIINKGKK